MSEQTLESRARKAKHELEITAEAHTKLRRHLLEEAVVFASNGDQTNAYQNLLKVTAIDALRVMIGVPVQDYEYEAEAARIKASLGQAN